MNADLKKDIEKELLHGENGMQIQRAAAQHQEGKIRIFVERGRYQGVKYVPVEYLKGRKSGLSIGVYADVMNTVLKTLDKMERYIERGCLVVEYKANKAGVLEYLRFHHRDAEFHGSDSAHSV